jgi:hypothetical protein
LHQERKEMKQLVTDFENAEGDKQQEVPELLIF